MVVLPPGTLLQLMYLRERLKHIAAGRFVEIGPGGGEITGLLLELGWTGVAYDLESQTIDALRNRFKEHLTNGRLTTFNQDFMASPPTTKADLVISCMVMEHMDDQQQSLFMDQAARFLNGSGLMIGLVPGSPAHWGIEDEIAGHFRRYTRQALQEFVQKSRWNLIHLAGLTCPISNIVLPLSNYLVRRAEKAKLGLPTQERTKLSGRRHVMFKTQFPVILALLLNRSALYPFHIAQKLFSGSERALVLYFEARPVL